MNKALSVAEILLVEDRPMCDCHSKPCYWVSDGTCRKGGWWRCGESTRKAAKRYSVSDAGKKAHKRFWHKPGGGYCKRRKQDLQDQRVKIIDQLESLEEEIRVAQS